MRMALTLAQLAVRIGNNDKVVRKVYSICHALSSHTEYYACLMTVPFFDVVSACVVRVETCAQQYAGNLGSRSSGAVQIWYMMLKRPASAHHDLAGTIEGLQDIVACRCPALHSRRCHYLTEQDDSLQGNLLDLGYSGRREPCTRLHAGNGSRNPHRCNTKGE